MLILKKLLAATALAVSALCATPVSAADQDFLILFAQIHTKVNMKVWKGPNNGCDILVEYLNRDGTLAIAPRWEFIIPHGTTINVAMPYAHKKEERRYTCVNGAVASW